MYKKGTSRNIKERVIIVNDYRNDVNDDFKKCQNLEKLLMMIFIIIIVVSIINVIFNNNYIVYFLIFLNIGYILTSFINDIYFKNNAELERRKTNISNAFNVNLTSKKTNKFYNNNCAPSLKKLGINIFENTLYTKNILLIMIINAGIKTFFLLIMWIFIIYNIENINIFQIAIQFLFSTEIFLNFIKIIYYYCETDKIISL